MCSTGKGHGFFYAYFLRKIKTMIKIMHGRKCSVRSRRRNGFFTMANMVLPDCTHKQESGCDGVPGHHQRLQSDGGCILYVAVQQCNHGFEYVASGNQAQYARYHEYRSRILENACSYFTEKTYQALMQRNMRNECGGSRL